MGLLRPIWRLDLIEYIIKLLVVVLILVIDNLVDLLDGFDFCFELAEDGLVLFVFLFPIVVVLVGVGDGVDE